MERWVGVELQSKMDQCIDGYRLVNGRVNGWMAT